MIINEISKGITHIEDLSVADLLETLRTISEYEITEKVDGAQLLFGIDENGFYTSRETKGGKRIYAVEDYEVKFQTTYIRSAHKLLEEALPLLKGAGLKRGDQVEAEVLYGELPNVVPYSEDTNYIIFLRTTEGSVNINRLKQKLDGKSLSVNLQTPFTEDGKTINLREETNAWMFSRSPVLENKAVFEEIAPLLKRLQKSLTVVDIDHGQTVATILETPLNKTPSWVVPGTWQDVKPILRIKKENIQSTLLRECIMPIKEILLNQLVRNTQSEFGPPLSEGGWIEGVVLRHPVSKKMVKIVDKNTFGTIRESAWKERNRLTESAKGIMSEAGFMGRLFLDLATSIGHPELGTLQAKNYLRKAGSITEERLTNLSENVDFHAVKSYWISLLEIKKQALAEDLDKYEKETTQSNSERLQRAVKQRTLQTYANSFERINEMLSAATQAEKTDALLTILVGRQLGEI